MNFKIFDTDTVTEFTSGSETYTALSLATYAQVNDGNINIKTDVIPISKTFKFAIRG